MLVAIKLAQDPHNLTSAQHKEMAALAYTLFALAGLGPESIRSVKLRVDENTTITLGTRQRKAILFTASFEVELVPTIDPQQTLAAAKNITATVDKAGSLADALKLAGPNSSVPAFIADHSLVVDVSISDDTVPTTTAHTTVCEAGFEVDASASNVCVDVDECTLSGDTPSESGAATAEAFGPFATTAAPSTTNTTLPPGVGAGLSGLEAATAGGNASRTCHEHARCVNSPGSFSCVCDDGWHGNGVDECADTNECAETPGGQPCHANATCYNNAGSFTCDCGPGWSGNGLTCEDVDECHAGADHCGDHTHCVNTVGSFACVCDQGWAVADVGCADLDECAAGKDGVCHPQALCSNTVGSYTCTCNPGWAGDGATTCSDVDECSNVAMVDCSGRAFTNAECSTLPSNAQLPPSTCTLLLETWRNDGVCDKAKPSLFCTELGCDGTDCLRNPNTSSCPSVAGAFVIDRPTACPMGSACENLQGSYRCAANTSNTTGHGWVAATTQQPRDVFGPTSAAGVSAATSSDTGSDRVLLVFTSVCLVLVILAVSLVLVWRHWLTLRPALGGDKVLPRRPSTESQGITSPAIFASRRASRRYSHDPVALALNSAAAGGQSPGASRAGSVPAPSTVLPAVTGVAQAVDAGGTKNTGEAMPTANRVALRGAPVLFPGEASDASLRGIGVPQVASTDSNLSIGSLADPVLDDVYQHHAIEAEFLRQSLYTSKTNPCNARSPDFPAAPPVLALEATIPEDPPGRNSSSAHRPPGATGHGHGGGYRNESRVGQPHDSGDPPSTWPKLVRFVWQMGPANARFRVLRPPPRPNIKGVVAAKLTQPRKASKTCVCHCINGVLLRAGAQACGRLECTRKATSTNGRSGCQHNPSASSRSTWWARQRN